MSAYVNNKRLVKNTLLLYIRMFLIMGISLYTSRVVLRYLGVVDYGVYNIVGGVVALFSFINVTLTGATSRFLTFNLGQNNYESLTKTFKTTITVHIIIAFIIVLLAESIGLWFLYNKVNIPDDRFVDSLWVYQVSIFTAIISILQVPFTALIISHEDMNVYAYVSIYEALAKLVVAFILSVIVIKKLVIYSFMVAFVAFTLFIIYALVCRRKYVECVIKPQCDFSILMPILKYSGWDLYGNLSAMARTYGISVVLNLFFHSIINAATGIATQVQNAIMGFVENFMTAARPQIVKYYASGQMEEMCKLINNSAKYSFLLLFLISFPLIVECSYVLHLWLDIVPDFAIPFTQFSLMIGWNSALFRPVVFGIHATGDIKSMSLINGTIILLIIPLSYYAFVNGASPVYAYLFNIILLLLSSCVNLFQLHSLVAHFSVKSYLKYVLFDILKVVVPTALVLYILLSTIEEGFIRFIMSVSVSSIIIVVVTWFGVADKNLRLSFLEKIKSKFIKY